MKHLFLNYLLTLLMSMVGVTAFSQTFIAGGIKYNVLSENTVEVTSNGYGYYSGDIVIPASVDNEGKSYSVIGIGNFAFSGCRELTSVVIPQSVTRIGDIAFSYCDGLVSVTIPSSVTICLSNAFQNCKNLVQICVEAGNSTFDSRENCNAIIETSSNTLIIGCKSTVIPNSVTAIGAEAFHDCKELTTISIPSSVTMIYEAAFSYAGLQSVSIPNSVIQIEDYGFASCGKLETVVLGSGMTRLSKYSFEGSSNIKDMYCYTSQVLSASSRSFNNTSMKNATLHVPADLVESYKVTEPWNGFGNIVPLTDNDPKPTGIGMVHSSRSKANNYYDLQGRKVNNPEKGVYISNGKRVIVK